jgi:hypothetical protein
MTAWGKCRVCRCTERYPCEPPCGWPEPDLCSSCALVIGAIRAWMESANMPNLTALMREVRPEPRCYPRKAKAGAA